MSEWHTTTLGEFISLQRGHDLPQRTRRPGKVPVIGSGGPTGFHDTAKATGPGIAIGRAANLGAPTLILEDFWPLNTTLYVTDFHNNDVRFTYYLLKTIDLAGFNSGSVQPMLNRNYIRNFPLRVPGVHTQKLIAMLLGALDDKIAANDHITSTLMQLSQVYYQKTLAEKSWTSIQLKEVAHLIMGQSPPGEACNRDGVGSPLLNGPTEFGQYAPTPAQWTTAPARECKSGDLLLCVRGSTTGRTNWADREYAVGRGLAAIRARASIRHTAIIYQALLAQMPRLLGMTSGSVFPNLSRKAIQEFEIAWPSHETEQSLVELLDSFLNRVARLSQENMVLAELRDTLLPKLMSGQVRIRDAESVVEDAV